MINNCDDVPAGGIPWTLVVQRAREESLSYAFSLDWREGAGPRSLLRLGSAFSHEAKSGGQRKVGVKHPPRRAAVAFAAWRVQKYGQKDSRPNFHRPGGILVENKTESAGMSHAVFHIRRGDVERMWKTVRRGAYAENRWPVPDIHRRSGTGRERCRCPTAPPASRNSARPVAVSRAGRCRAFPLP